MYRLRTLHPDQNFTQVANHAMDHLPDLESLGLLNHVLRHDDDWDFRLEDLVEKKPGISRRGASKARATLIQYGYWVIVKYRHNYRGRFATDAWRAAFPHSLDDLAELGQKYMPGSITQIPQLDGLKRPRKDTHGRVLMREVTITWAQIESFRGVELVQFDGSLVPKEAKDETGDQDAA